MTINMPEGAKTDCDPFVATTGWTWAGDPDADVGSMTQCGNVRFYNIDNRGTRPFTISWIPVQGTPITVNVPNSATLNNSAFIYNSTVPFAQGTQFQIALGDAQGGASGGASELYVAGPSDDSSCLQPGYTLPNSVSDRAIPTANIVATFQNLAGAIDPSASSNSGGGGGGGGGGNNVGAIAGGAIGGAIALAIVVGCFIGYLLYKKRQKSKKEEARKEDGHFVDLDGDEDEQGGTSALAASRRRSRYRDGGVQQTYSVSPFMYQPTSGEDTPTSPLGLEMTSHSSQPGSLSGVSGADALAASSMARVPSSNHSGIRPTSSHSFGSGSGLLGSQSVPPVPPMPQAPFAFAEHARRESQGSTYRLRATNDDAANSSISGYAASSSRPEAGPLPQKGPLPGDEETESSSAPGRRVVMHSDGGPLPQPESDDEVEELPPQYGGWSQADGAQLNRGASTSRRRLD